MLELRAIKHQIGDCVALRGASLTLVAGRVHALVGENGAGKSTLIRAASGLIKPASGEVTMRGESLPLGDARKAMQKGVGVVHQHFMLVESESVLDNVVLGVEPRRGPLGLLVDRARARREVLALSEKHKMPVDPDALIHSLSVGERQRVEVLKVLYRGATAVLFDEPTAVLSPAEVQSLLKALRALADGGAAVLLVTHKLDEVFAVADEITVLRRGEVVLHANRSDTTPEAIARGVMGDAKPRELSTQRGTPGVEALSVKGVSAEGLTDATLTLRAGEVLGVAGVEGSGQKPLAECIVGLKKPSAGEVLLGAQSASGMNVAARRRAGVGYVPEDREARGLLGALSVAENVALGDPDALKGEGRFDRAEAERRARAVIERYRVRPDDPWLAVEALSGGNQQKVMIGRELSRTLKVLVLAQPTRGVDLGARAEIHAAVVEAREKGVGVLLISSELDELRALCDRVMVMRGGAVVGELPVAQASDEALGALMVGGAR